MTTYYADLVAAAMRSQKDAEPWFAYLRAKRARDTAEAEVIREWRKKRPGLTNSEILQRYGQHIAKECPVPDVVYGKSPNQ